jgi:transposase
VDFPEGRRAVPVLLAVWSYSQHAFAMALPDETTGSILHGTVCALEFFGCVPAELWWDIACTAVGAVGVSKQEKGTSRCLVISGNSPSCWSSVAMFPD